jgi:hypothetical protein
VSIAPTASLIVPKHQRTAPLEQREFPQLEPALP